MVWKIIKHELRFNFFNLLIIGGITIILTLILRFTDAITINPLNGILIGAIIISICLIIGFIFMAMQQAIHHSLFGNEAYITHSLPISKTKLFFAKYLACLIYLLLGLLIILLAISLPFIGEVVEIFHYVLNFGDIFPYLFIAFGYIMGYFHLAIMAIFLFNMFHATKYRVLIFLLVIWGMSQVFGIIISLPIIIVEEVSLNPGEWIKASIYMSGAIALAFIPLFLGLSVLIINKKLAIE